MAGIITIEIKNRLGRTKRKIRVYHRCTGIADIIVYNQSIVLPLKTFSWNGESDYLQISAAKNSPGPKASGCRFDLPAWVNLKLSSGIVFDISFTRHGKRNVLNISKGEGRWRLKIWRPVSLPPGITGGDQIIISDNRPRNDNTLRILRRKK